MAKQINDAADQVSKMTADAYNAVGSAAEDVKNAVMGGAPPQTEVGAASQTASAQVRLGCSYQSL